MDTFWLKLIAETGLLMLDPEFEPRVMLGYGLYTLVCQVLPEQHTSFIDPANFWLQNTDVVYIFVLLVNI